MARDGWDELDDFERDAFEHDGERRTVYRAGTGPGVVVIAEIPGITPEVAHFARKVVEIGCSVAMPVLFGDAGRPATVGYAVQTVAPVCVAKEFAALAVGKTAPVSEWLRALARDLHERAGGPGVGAVGMCFTGGFALGMMVDPVVLAPVLSQPSLPLTMRKGAKHDLHLSPADLEVVKERVAGGVCVLGLRFTNDRLSPSERFARLRQELGDGFVGVEIDSSPGNPHGFGKTAHSVLTRELVEEPGHPTMEALEQVLDLFRDRLLVPDGPSA
jgi:dienelactone hydrolase